MIDALDKFVYWAPPNGTPMAPPALSGPPSPCHKFKPKSACTFCEIIYLFIYYFLSRKSNTLITILQLSIGQLALP